MSIDKGMHGQCETVRITAPITSDNPSGYSVINKSDYDPEVHTLVGAEKKDAGKDEKPPNGNGKKSKDDGDAGKDEKPPKGNGKKSKDDGDAGKDEK